MPDGGQGGSSNDASDGASGGGSADAASDGGSGAASDGGTDMPFGPSPYAACSVQVAAGGFHSCARLTDGTVSCWGINPSGQLGDGTTTQHLTPQPVPNLAGAVQVIAGDFHTCALLASGSAVCWGGNDSGQIGDGTTLTRLSPTPVRDPTGVSNLAGIVSLSSHGSHTCALQGGSGNVYCWGLNDSGQLGDGTTVNRALPVQPSLPAASALGSMEDATCAVAGGAVYCWGDNTDYELGDGTNIERHSPVAVVGLPSAALAVAEGNQHTCALLADGTVECWGYNFLGALGNGSFTQNDQPTPGPVQGLSGAVAISSGDPTCVVVNDGTGRCWGFGGAGELGNGTTSNSDLPVVVSAPAGITMINMSGMAGGGWSHACASFTDGSVRCWGDNEYGQVGNGTVNPTSGVTTPTLVPIGGGGPNGTCSCAAPGDSVCGNTCINTSIDNNNCGACGKVCASGLTCQGGQCLCPAGKTDCNGTCVDTSSDDSNCG
jgi:alpha-tubulin suppressor-like RCC1 family protein